MTPQAKAESKMSGLTMKALKECWKHTENKDAFRSNKEFLPTVRGWILDEFERRDAAGFEKFLDSHNLADIN
jgi:hypothetical protein